MQVRDESLTRFDGKRITAYPKECLDSNWEVFRIDSITGGSHSITGDDSGVGVWVYGYGFDESYAWSSPSQCKTFKSPDSIAPVATIATQCSTSFIHLADTGSLPSKLDMIRFDSAYNMNYTVDPNWIEGAEFDTSNYALSVFNPSKPAILIVSVFDCAGNHTTITSIYAPAIDSMRPSWQNLGTWIAPNPARIAFDTLNNPGTTVFDITELHLLKGNVGFSLFDSIGGPLDLSPLQPGQRRLIQIQFKAVDSALVIDSIIYGNDCGVKSVAVIGAGGAADFFVTSQSWPDELVTSSQQCYPKTVTIFNFSTDTLTIDQAFWKDIIHFRAVTTFPVIIPPSPASVPFIIDYCPDFSSLTQPNSTQGSWTSPQVRVGTIEVPHFDSLTGFAIAPSETFAYDMDTTFDCAPANDTATASFRISAVGTANSIIDRVLQSNATDFFNLTGTLPNGTTWNPATSAQTLTPGQTAIISVQYIVPDSQNMTFVDSLFAIDGSGDTIGPESITVNVIYNAVMTNPDSLTFGPVPFQGQNTQNTTTFEIQNTANTPFTIYGLDLQPGIYDPAFSFAPLQPATLPDTLPVGGHLIITVYFNDSLFSDPIQTALLVINANACAPLSENLIAYLSELGVKQAIVPSLEATIIPADDGRSLEIILPTDMNGPVSLTLVNVLGESVLRETFDAGTQNVDASSLPRGVYFYRLTSGQMSQSGKVILGE